MNTIAVILVMLLTMPISYAMLDEVVKKVRLKDRMSV